MKTVALKIEQEDKDRLIVLSGVLGMPMKDVIHMVLVYLEGIDYQIGPDQTLQNVKKRKGQTSELLRIEKEMVTALKENKSTFISYFKEQEKQILLPMLEKMGEMMTVMLHYLRNEAPRRIELERIFNRLSQTETAAEISGCSPESVQQLSAVWEVFREFLSQGIESRFGQSIHFNKKVIDYYLNEIHQITKEL